MLKLIKKPIKLRRKAILVSKIVHGLEHECKKYD